MKLLMTLALAASFVILGCSSVGSRIKENERLFGTLAPEAQAQIQNGRIDRGFTEDMVHMAMGKPDAKETVQRDGKTVLVWKYVRRDLNAPRDSATGLSSPYSFPTFGPGPSHPSPVIYDRKYYKIEFIGGKVVRWDAELQEDLPTAH